MLKLNSLWCDSLYLTNDSDLSIDSSLISFYVTTQCAFHSFENLSRVQERREEILRIRELWRSFIAPLQARDLFYSRLGAAAVDISSNGTYQVNNLIPVSEGISGTYFLKDQFVIKPFDEEAGCINNPKGLRGDGLNHFIRRNVPLYHAAMREALAYKIALEAGLEGVVPNTKLAVLRADQFYDCEEGVSSQEKLCSVQEYVRSSKNLFEMISHLENEGLSKSEIEARFDQDDFEAVNLLVWVTGDTDAHFGNILAYPKENGLIGLKKIDNGLAFPDTNEACFNALVAFRKAKDPLSDSMKEKIAGLKVESLARQLASYGLGSAVPALRARVLLLQELALVPDMTIRVLNRMVAS